MYKYRSTLEKQLQLEQLLEYESQHTLTHQERRQLRRWVRGGNDVIPIPGTMNMATDGKWTLSEPSEWMRIFTKQEKEWQKKKSALP